MSARGLLVNGAIQAVSLTVAAVLWFRGSHETAFLAACGHIAGAFAGTLIGLWRMAGES